MKLKVYYRWRDEREVSQRIMKGESICDCLSKFYAFYAQVKQGAPKIVSYEVVGSDDPYNCIHARTHFYTVTEYWKD